MGCHIFMMYCAVLVFNALCPFLLLHLMTAYCFYYHLLFLYCCFCFSVLLHWFYAFIFYSLMYGYCFYYLCAVASGYSALFYADGFRNVYFLFLFCVRLLECPHLRKGRVQYILNKYVVHNNISHVASWCCIFVEVLANFHETIFKLSHHDKEKFSTCEETL